MKYFLALLLLWPLTGISQEQRQKVMVMEIRDDIDPRMARYVKLALEHAEEISADYVIVDMDTYGGVVADAKEITQLILAYKKPIWVFINDDAASAGALISIACDSIYMTAGASIGAATVVEGAGGPAAPDKYQSYMRSTMRSTAEASGRDPRIAEGMVDEKIVIDSIKQAGKVITLTTSEAIAVHYCEAQVERIEDILSRNHVNNYEIERFDPGTVEKIVAFFLNPVISGFLILIIVAGLYFEFQAPGTLFPIAASGVALILYLVPYYLTDLAQSWEIILLVIGLALLLVEFFVIPGFGVTGIAGITCTILALVVIMLDNDYFNFEMVGVNQMVAAVLATIGGLAGGGVLLIFGGQRILSSRAFKRITLENTMTPDDGYVTTVVPQTVIGQTGMAYTVLRPAGKIKIDNDMYDAVTSGEYIEQGTTIIVISIESNTLKVKKHTSPE